MFSSPGWTILFSIFVAEVLPITPSFLNWGVQNWIQYSRWCFISFLELQVKLVGQWFLVSSSLLFLKTGRTLFFLQSSGSSSILYYLSKAIQRSLPVTSVSSLDTFGCIPLGPMDLCVDFSSMIPDKIILSQSKVFHSPDYVCYLKDLGFLWDSLSSKDRSKEDIL